MKNKKEKLLLLTGIVFVCLCLATSAYATKWYVDASVTSSGTGESWSQALKTIQEAIAKADSRWMICYAPFDSIYVKSGAYNLSSTVIINKVVSIYGGFPRTAAPAFADRDPEAYPTIIDGNNTYQCIKATASYFVLDGFTIREGYASYASSDDSSGGGLYADKTPNYCSFNESYMSPIIRNCKFTGNTATEVGGAIYDGGADLRITNCRFSNNSAKSGAGIYAVYSSPVIKASKFIGNAAMVYGGALCGRWCNQTTEAIAYMINCVFHDNSAQIGGAVYSYIFYPRIWNCTFYQNSATSDGGGFHSYDAYSNPADIKNCIFWGNTPNQLRYNVSSSTYLDVDWSDIQGGWTPVEHNINIDPGFAGASDFHLTEGSPCIDAGRSFSTYSEDIEGVLRPQDGDFDGLAEWDMGAYEFEGYSPDSDDDGDKDGKDLYDLINNFSLAKMIIFCEQFGSID
ncbi:right-handed parallel beta-helix repeat-containing protein [uncultured Desulfobacter sp.]|uniref:right-handed parallel beta-helix repeat-containing protein n=1 Tax=uncultured Desulfobacter sp. TaxID=240139 RepID=UPI002AA609C5|nr:right-handed parallel beta-helix repeat-containing protein [uncultured Desulfobacter sp.]